jgi:hypothetical protein
MKSDGRVDERRGRPSAPPRRRVAAEAIDDDGGRRERGERSSDECWRGRRIVFVDESERASERQSSNFARSSLVPSAASQCVARSALRAFDRKKSAVKSRSKSWMTLENADENRVFETTPLA